MSALGQKRTSPDVRFMSALPPKADIGWACRDVRFVPKAEVAGGILLRQVLAGRSNMSRSHRQFPGGFHNG